MLQIHSVITQVRKIGYYECACHPDTSDGITQIFKINFRLTNIDQWLKEYSSQLKSCFNSIHYNFLFVNNLLFKKTFININIPN